MVRFGAALRVPALLTGGNSAGSCIEGAPGEECYASQNCESGVCLSYECQ